MHPFFQAIAVCFHVERPHIVFIAFHETCLMADLLFAAFPLECFRASPNDATPAAEAG